MEKEKINLIFKNGVEDHPLFQDIVPHIRQRFWKYQTENPHVLDLFLKYSRQAKAANFSHYSVRTIQERIRWHLNIETKKDFFKVNDHYTPCYARMMIALFPEEFKDFFELRSHEKNHQIYRSLNYHEGNEPTEAGLPLLEAGKRK